MQQIRRRSHQPSKQFIQQFENFEVIDPAEEIANISVPTLESEIIANDITPEFNGRLDNNQNQPREIHHLLRIFKAMEINREQMAKIQEFAAQYRRCMHEVMLPLMEQRRAIIQRANLARQEIVSKVRAGELSREEAAIMLERLHIRTQEALKALINWDARCACLHQYYRAIASVLDEKQLVMWQRFISTLEGPCFQVKTRG